MQVRIESGITPEKALETDSAKGVEDRVVLLDAMKAGGQKAFDQAWEKLGLSEKSASPGSNRS